MRPVSGTQVSRYAAEGSTSRTMFLAAVIGKAHLYIIAFKTQVKYVIIYLLINEKHVYID